MRRQAGFTIVEFLVGSAVAALVLAGAGVAFQLGAQTVRSSADQAEAQQNARWALERMAQEIRGAGLDPKASPPTYTFDAITSPTATSLILQNDHDGDGVLDPPGGCDVTAARERVSYRLVDTRLRRSTDPPAYSCEGSIVHGVSGLQFTYLDADGVVTATPSAIRTVVITLTIESLSGGVKRKVSLTDRVRLRNR